MPRNAHLSAAIALPIVSLVAVAVVNCANIVGFNDYQPSGGAGGTSSANSAGSGSGGSSTHPLWSQHFGGIGPDSVTGHHGVDADATGTNVYVTGLFNNSITFGTGTLMTNNFAFFLAKLDAMTGSPIWAKKVAETTVASSALAATSNGVVVTGSFNISATNNGMMVASQGLHDVFLARYDSLGTLVWANAFGDPQEQYATAVAVDAMDRIYVTGQFSGALSFGGACSMNSGSPVGFVAQFDGTGTCLWARQFIGPSYGQSITLDNTGVIVGGGCDGQVTVGGYMAMCPVSETPFITKLDPAGNAIFLYTLPSGTRDVHIVGNPTGGVFFGATQTPGPPISNGRLLVGELTSSGTVAWLKTHGMAMQAHLHAITRAPSGELFITGVSAGPLDFVTPPAQNHGLDDMFLVRLSATGEALGGLQFGDGERQSGRSLHADKEGNVYLYGDFKNTIDFGSGSLFSTGDYDVALAKLSVGSSP